MPQIINTNILAQNAQRQLNKSQASQATSIERLSSGLRINSAKDDAAGLAISTRFETQVRGLNQAVRNANDGISLAQTAEGSLQEMGNIMQRMRELAVQSANDTNSDQDRLSLQAEVDQLYNELERISDSTEFNGVKLLDGSAGERIFQVGANSGQSISFSVESVTAEGLDLNNFSSTGDLNGGRVSSATLSDIGANTLEINNVAIDAYDFGTDGTGVDDATNITQFRDHLNEQTQSTGVTAEAYNVVTGANANGTTSGLQIQVGPNAAVTVSDSSSVAELASNINRDIAGVNAIVDASGGVQLTNDTGQSISIGGNVAGSGFEAGTFNGYISLTSSENTEITVNAGTAGTAADIQALGFNNSTGSANVTGTSFEASAITDADKITINDVEIGAIELSTTGQQGFNVAEAINSVSAQTGVTATIGATTITSAVNLTKADLGAGSFSINSVDFNGTYADVDAVADAINTAAALPANAPELGDLVASVDTDDNLVLTSASGADINIDQNVGTLSDLSNTELRLDVVEANLAEADGTLGFVINGISVSDAGDTTTQELADDINADATLLDVTASVDADTGELVLTSNNGAEITVSTDDDTLFTNLDSTANGTATNGLFTAALSLESTNGEDIQIGSNAAADATLTVGARGATVLTDTINATFFNSGTGDPGDGETVSINGVQVEADDDTYTNNAAGVANLAEDINTAMTTAGFDIVATTDGTDMTLTSASGQDIIINQTTNQGFTTVVADADVMTRADVTLTTGVTAESQQASAVEKLGLTRQGGNEEVTGLGLSITTVANAGVAIEKIDAALDQVSSVRANLGAFQNRLGSTISNLENVSQNLSAANSRIRDADFAIETANLSKTQILQQAGIAMLSQANASQQNVLSLLG